jgi:hypothetical protein
MTCCLVAGASSNIIITLLFVCLFTSLHDCAFPSVPACNLSLTLCCVLFIMWGPLSLVSKAEELLDRKVAAPV